MTISSNRPVTWHAPGVRGGCAWTAIYEVAAWQPPKPADQDPLNCAVEAPG